MSKRRITVDLGETLLTAVEAVVAERRESRNQFIADALRRTLKEIERARIDAAFARMADDAEYQALLLDMEREWAPLSDEAWRHIEDAERHDGVSY